MKRHSKIILLLFLPLLLANLSACVSGKPEAEVRDRGGTVVETDRESCIRICNREYDRCLEMLSPTRNEMGDQPSPKPFGISSECKDSLRTCLNRCKGR